MQQHCRVSAETGVVANASRCRCLFFITLTMESKHGKCERRQRVWGLRERRVERGCDERRAERCKGDFLLLLQAGSLTVKVRGNDVDFRSIDSVRVQPTENRSFRLIAFGRGKDFFLGRFVEKGHSIGGSMVGECQNRQP